MLAKLSLGRYALPAMAAAIEVPGSVIRHCARLVSAPCNLCDAPISICSTADTSPDCFCKHSPQLYRGAHPRAQWLCVAAMEVLARRVASQNTADRRRPLLGPEHCRVNIAVSYGAGCAQDVSHLQELLCLLQEAQDILRGSSACSSSVQLVHHLLTCFRHHTRALKA